MHFLDYIEYQARNPKTTSQRKLVKDKKQDLPHPTLGIMDGTPLALGINPLLEKTEAEAVPKRLNKAKAARLARVTARRVKKTDVVATSARAAEDQSRIDTQKCRETLEEQVREENAAALEGVEERRRGQREERQLWRDAAMMTEELEVLERKGF